MCACVCGELESVCVCCREMCVWNVCVCVCGRGIVCVCVCVVCACSGDVACVGAGCVYGEAWCVCVSVCVWWGYGVFIWCVCVVGVWCVYVVCACSGDVACVGAGRVCVCVVGVWCVYMVCVCGVCIISHLLKLVIS